MGKSFHMCINVKGVLTNWKHKDLKGMFSIDGRSSTADETKAILLDELSKGHECIPIGKCDNFDYKTGCKGHEKL